MGTGLAAPTPSTDHLLAALSLLDDTWLLAGLDEKILQVEDHIAFLAATDRDRLPVPEVDLHQCVADDPGPDPAGPRRFGNVREHEPRPASLCTS